MKKVRLRAPFQDLIEIDEHTRAHSPHEAAPRQLPAFRQPRDDLRSRVSTLSEKTGLRTALSGVAPYMLI